MSEVEVNMQLRTSSAKFNTDGRTDGRTKKLVAVDESLTAVDARREDGFSTLAEILHGGLHIKSERHPITRTGERNEIPAHVRSAVWFRDKGRCELCATSQWVEGPWHLDHITPWSAGGSDDTTNLRVLCEFHNLARSNHVDPTERPRMAATWWCERCYGVDREAWTYVNGTVFCPLHAKSNRNTCAVQRAYDWGNQQEGWEPWHQRQQVLEPTTPAYCAHCRMPGVTDVTL